MAALKENPNSYICMETGNIKRMQINVREEKRGKMQLLNFEALLNNMDARFEKHKFFDGRNFNAEVVKIFRIDGAGKDTLPQLTALLSKDLAHYRSK